MSDLIHPASTCKYKSQRDFAVNVKSPNVESEKQEIEMKFRV